jgi:hypothetical protein
LSAAETFPVQVKCKQKFKANPLTIAVFSPLEFAFCPAFPIIEGELCEGETISFMSVSIVVKIEITK